MSSENLQVVSDLYEAGNRGDIERMAELAVPDFEWETDPRLPNAGVYRGWEEIRRFLEDQAAPFEDIQIRVEQTFTKGDDVVAFLRIHRRIRGSTADFEIRVGHLWKFRDGKPIRCQAFARREEALEAAGIPNPPG